jgi:hypothetical protein
MTHLRRSSALGLAALSIVAGCAATQGFTPSDSADHGQDAVSLATDRPAMLGINIDPMNKLANPSAEEIAALGATRVRLELKVPYLESATAYEELRAAFDTYDPVITERLGKVSVLLILDYATLDQKRSGPSTEEGYRQDFADRAAAVAEHYQALGVDHFEIWNEEDLCEKDYCPFMPPAAFGALLAGATSAIHGVNEGAQVALGGLGSGSWESYLPDVVDAMGDAWSSVDAVGVHPYIHWPKATGRGNELEYQLSRCSEIGKGKPLWLTEWGDGGSQASTESAYFAFFADDSIPEAQLVTEAYLFAWSDAQHEAPNDFGLYSRDGARKDPEWNAFHDAATAADEGSR